VNRLIEEVAAVDPDFAKTLLRNQRRNFAFAVISVLAVLAAGYAIAVNFQQDTKITRVEHSACQEDPHGKECQKTKLEAARAANIYVTCVPFWKAGYRCPKPGSPAAQRRAIQAKSKEVQNLEEGAPTSHAEQPASPVGGTDVSSPPKGGGDETPGPTTTSPGPAVPSPAPSPTTTGSSAGDGASSEPEPEVDQEEPQETEQVKPGLIGNPGGVLGKTACGLGQLTEVAGIRVCTE